MLLSLDRRTEAWHDWRNGHDLVVGKPRITGTAAANIHGVCPSKALHGLWRELMGLADPDPISYVMQRGIDLEDLAREFYVAFTGNDAVPICVDLNISADTVAKYRKEQSIRKRVSVTGEMPIQLPDNKVKLVLPTYVASGTPARGLAHWWRSPWPARSTPMASVQSVFAQRIAPHRHFRNRP